MVEMSSARNVPQRLVESLAAGHGRVHVRVSRPKLNAHLLKPGPRPLGDEVAASVNIEDHRPSMPRDNLEEHQVAEVVRREVIVRSEGFNSSAKPIVEHSSLGLARACRVQMDEVELNTVPRMRTIVRYVLSSLVHRLVVVQASGAVSQRRGHISLHRGPPCLRP